MGIFYCALSALINFLTSFIVCAVLFTRTSKSQLNRSLAYFAFSVGFWSFCYFCWQISTTSSQALFWNRALMAGAIYIPSTFFHLNVVFVQKYKKYRREIYFWYSISTIFLIIDFTKFFVRGVEPKLSFPFWGIPGVAYAPFLCVFVGLVLYSHYLLYRAYSDSSGLVKSQIKGPPGGVKAGSMLFLWSWLELGY